MRAYWWQNGLHIKPESEKDVKALSSLKSASTLPSLLSSLSSSIRSSVRAAAMELAMSFNFGAKTLSTCSWSSVRACPCVAPGTEPHGRHSDEGREHLPDHGRLHHRSFTHACGRLRPVPPADLASRPRRS